MDSSRNSIEEVTDEEFDIDEHVNKNPAVVLQRLKEFAFYLVENIEFNLDFCLKLLEERTVSPKPSSMHVTALSLLCSAIPKIGGGLGSALKTGEVTLFRKIEKKNSRILADLVYYYSDNKEIFRNTIIEAAAEVFTSFENQFMLLTCDGGEKRAMQKLAIDASDRIFNYFLITEQRRNVSKSEIIKGIIVGDSKRNRAGKKEGKSVFKPDKKVKSDAKDQIKWKTCKLYSKAGIAIVHRNLFYKNDQTKPQKYGYRKIFSFEDENDIMTNWTLDDHFEIQSFTLEITNDLLQTVKEYVMTKNPYEVAKLERLKFNQVAMNDRQEKHEEALKILKEYFNKILDQTNELVLKVTNINIENAVLLKNVSENQEEETKLQTVIISKLEIVHDDVLETKEKHGDLVKTNEIIKINIVEIKNNQEEMARVVVKQGDVEELVNNKVKESTREELKECVRDTFRENDPGPGIKREIERSLRKGEKELKRAKRRLRKLFGSGIDSDENEETTD